MSASTASLQKRAKESGSKLRASQFKMATISRYTHTHTRNYVVLSSWYRIHKCTMYLQIQRHTMYIWDYSHNQKLSVCKLVGTDMWMWTDSLCVFFKIMFGKNSNWAVVAEILMNTVKLCWKNYVAGQLQKKVALTTHLDQKYMIKDLLLKLASTARFAFSLPSTAEHAVCRVSLSCVNCPSWLQVSCKDLGEWSKIKESQDASINLMFLLCSY